MVIYSYVVASPKHTQTLSSRMRLGQLFPLCRADNMYYRATCRSLICVCISLTPLTLNAQARSSYQDTNGFKIVTNEEISEIIDFTKLACSDADYVPCLMDLLDLDSAFEGPVLPTGPIDPEIEPEFFAVAHVGFVVQENDVDQLFFIDLYRSEYSPGIEQCKIWQPTPDGQYVIYLKSLASQPVDQQRALTNQQMLLFARISLFTVYACIVAFVGLLAFRGISALRHNNALDRSGSAL